MNYSQLQGIKAHERGFELKSVGPWSPYCFCNHSEYISGLHTAGMEQFNSGESRNSVRRQIKSSWKQHCLNKVHTVLRICIPLNSVRCLTSCPCSQRQVPQSCSSERSDVASIGGGSKRRNHPIVLGGDQLPYITVYLEINSYSRFTLALSWHIF